jgi:hypothetical protein
MSDKRRPAEQKNLTGHFPAKLAWALEPIAEYAEDDLRFWDGSLFMEPAPDGGAFVGAVSGHVMAVFHSREAWCNAPMTFRVPIAAFCAACAPEPVNLTFCGESHPVDVPEWMQPDTFWATNAGMFITTKMRAPCFAEEERAFQPVLFQRTASVGVHEIGIDYAAKAGVAIDWRRPLVSASTEAPGPALRSFAANPFIVSRLERIFDLALEESAPDAPPLFFHRPTGTPESPGPILITISGRPDIVATYMPMKTDGDAAPPVPWSFLKKPSQATPGAEDAA